MKLLPTFLRPRQSSQFPLQTYEVIAVLVAYALLTAQIVRFASAPEIWGWAPLLVFLLGYPLADFVSGLVHWGGDTWGNEHTPLIGRFIKPFRVHHDRPRDLLGTHFLSTNSDAAFAFIPYLAAAFFFPLDWEWSRLVSTLLFGIGVFGLPTSQIHKWAHMRRPPRPVKWLQKCRLILGPKHHDVHHKSPHLVNYCITTGWCNPILNWTGFFPKLEWLARNTIGLKPTRG